MKRRNFIKLLSASSVMVMLPRFVAGNQNIQNINNVFNDGDTVCFIGDSITHNGAWYIYVSNYFVTRFPKIKIKFINCGISGDIAAGALKRLKDDVLTNKPNHSVIMLGMNDVQRELYETDSPSPENLIKRHHASERYRSDMERIVVELKNNGCSSIILVTPSPYDETALIDKSNLIKVNEELENYSDIIKGISRKYETRFVDFHSSMTSMSQLLQETDPKFTFTPNDRIHPGELGHQYMAYLFLEALKVSPIVSEVSFTFNKIHPTRLLNVKPTVLVSSTNKISFELFESALLYPIRNDTLEIYNMVPIEDKLNRQMIQIISLPSSRWNMHIDGIDVGEFSSKELQQGINLSKNNKTPQFIQAQKVLETNLDYYHQEVKYRDFVKVNIMLKDNNIDLNNDNQINSFFETFPKTDGKYAESYFTGLFRHYIVNKKNLAQDKEKLELLYNQLNSCNQPKVHYFELSKV
jgi:lysophospholipase L1-like esterase